MSTIIFRDAVLLDVAELVRLRILMQAEVHSIALSNIATNFTLACEDYFAKSLQDQTYFSAVAELDGQLISANGLVIYRKPPSVNGVSGLVGYVTNVYTLPEFRGQGIARILMEKLIQLGKEANVTKLHLGSTESGKSIYERVGFKPVDFEALELRL